jgi:hypothetical protein
MLRKLSLRLEAMFMQSAILARRASGESGSCWSGRAVGEENPWPTCMEKGHGTPSSKLLEYRPCSSSERKREGAA